MRGDPHEVKVRALVNQLRALGVNIRHHNHQMIVSKRDVTVDDTGVIQEQPYPVYKIEFQRTGGSRRQWIGSSFLRETQRAKVLGRKRLLANRKNLDYWIRSEMDQALKHYPNLNELYRTKEKLHTLYRSKGFLRAYQSYMKLITSLKNSTQTKLKTLLRTLKKWRDEILNYFSFPVTNAVTEAINGNAKALQRRARGYRQFKNYRRALLNACAF